MCVAGCAIDCGSGQQANRSAERLSVQASSCVYVEFPQLVDNSHKMKDTVIFSGLTGRDWGIKKWLPKN